MLGSFQDARDEVCGPSSPFETIEAHINGVRIRVWKNAPPTIRELVALAMAHGDKPFLSLGAVRVSYAEFFQRALDLGYALGAAGVKKGDRVAIAMRNCPEWVIAHYAALCIGAISVPLNAWLKAAELAHCLADSQPSVVFADPPRLALIAAAWPIAIATAPAFRPPLLVTVPDYGADGSPAAAAAAAATVPAAGTGSLPAGAGFQPVRGFAEFETSAGRGHEAMAPADDLGPEDDATIMYTSGTTGLPKGALSTHRNLLSVPFLVAAGNAVRELAAEAEAAATGGPPPPPPPTNRTALLVVPLFHATAAMSILLPAVAGGAHLVMMRKWDAAEALRLIEKEGVSSFVGVPTQLWQILDNPAVNKVNLSSLRDVVTGGAPSSEALQGTAERKMPKASSKQFGLMQNLTNGYGLTETTGGCITNSGKDYARRPDSVGRASGVTEVMVVEPGTIRQLPIGQIGELAIKSPMVIKGYWNNPDATHKSIRDGWLLTGDAARIDDEGLIYILDRFKDMVIRGGENVYCAEVESVLFGHPAVSDCAVLGLPDRVMGERVAAVVMLAQGGPSVTPEDLRAYCAARLAHFKVPEVVVLRAAPPLPRNAAGKVLKRELRKEILAAGAGGKARL
ncbi:hypothetical protein HK405_012596 [Cladochytrium tenue]|nr:hypothetical protein HK405_012596 [Cladochytrium tenue]